jgi:hypothetical protein
MQGLIKSYSLLQKITNKKLTTLPKLSCFELGMVRKCPDWEKQKWLRSSFESTVAAAAEIAVAAAAVPDSRRSSFGTNLQFSEL